MEEREEEREGKRALREELALARAPRHFVRMKGGPHNNKVVHSFDLLLYMLAIRWVVDDMALAYSQQLAILLTMLLMMHPDVWPHRNALLKAATPN